LMALGHQLRRQVTASGRVLLHDKKKSMINID
jgi:hypothetical protein